MKLFIKIIIAVVIIAVGFGLFSLYRLWKYNSAIDSIELSQVKFSTLKNGTYTGAYDVDYIFASVNIVVEDGIVKDIKLNEHKNDRGTGAEIIVKKVKEAQSLQVDTISGATNSSKVILKAIDNAIEKAKR